MNNYIFFAIFLLSSIVFAEGPQDFDKYSSEVIYSGELKSIDFESHKLAKKFKTRLNALVGSSPNFSGKYVLTSWGCGSGCQMISMVNTINGSVHFMNKPASYGYCHIVNSSLIIVDPISEELIEGYGGVIPKWFKTKYYEWDGKSFVLLSETQRKTKFKCVPS